MESENFIFLILFFSVISCLWGWTKIITKKIDVSILKRPELESTRVEDLPPINGKPPFRGGESPPYPTTVLSNGIGGLNGDFSFFLSSFCVLSANLLLTFFLLSRWIESGHPPFSNLYESLLFLTWALLLFYFPATTVWGIVTTDKEKSDERVTQRGDSSSVSINLTKAFPDSGLSDWDFKKLIPKWPSNEASGLLRSSSKLSSLAGMLLVSAALFIYTFATFILPSEMREIKPLVPALKSNWLLMHVSIMLLSYSALLAGSLFCIMYLVIFYSEKKKKDNELLGPSTAGVVRGLDLQSSASGDGHTPVAVAVFTTSKIQFLNDLDALSYRSLAFAFPLLTLGIISGAVWANEAWGSYWSWDPKETWALITWFTFSIYLHLRIQKSWEGEKAALVGSFGFCVIWICYLGVNLLGKGLHSYGWWNS